MTRRLSVAVALLALALVGAPPALAAANFGGVWKLLPANPPADQPVREGVLTLKQEAEKVTGTLMALGMTMTLQDVTVKENELRFSVTAEREGVQRTATVKITLNGDTLKGIAEGASPEPIDFTGARQPAATLAGTWSLTIETPNQTYKPTVTLTQEGEKLTGSLRTEDGIEAKLVSGSVKGDAVAFVVDLTTAGGDDLHLEFSAKRSEKGLKGDVAVGGQSYPWSAERAVTATAPAK